MAPGVVVGRVLLARDQLLGVEELLVRTGAHFIWCREKVINRLIKSNIKGNEVKQMEGGGTKEGQKEGTKQMRQEMDE